MNHLPTGSTEHLYTTYSSEGRIENLAGKILNAKRSKPIVLLTARQYERVPALDAGFVREVVGPDVDICFVPRADLTRQLEELLPPKLHAFGGAARIYWPGVSDRSKPEAHPFIYDANGTYGSLSEQRFRDHWNAGAPAKREATADDPQMVLARQERDAAVRGREEAVAEQARRQEQLRQRDDRIRQLQEDIARLRKEHRSELATVSSIETERAAAQLTPADALRRDIHSAYLDAISEADRDQYPLGAFTFHDEFVESVADLAPEARRKVPKVCAQVACGIAPQLDGRDVHRYRASAAGGSPDRIRQSDGAIAMRCAIQRGAHSAPRLHYWLPDNGPVQFAVAVTHDDDRCPE